MAWWRDPVTTARVTCHCHEEDARNDAARTTKPALQGDRACRKGVIERGSVAGDSPASRPIAGQDEDSRHRPRRPTAVASHSRRQPGLSIQSVQHRLEIRHHGFDFDHEKSSRRPVERQDVDGSALTTHVERHLGGTLPAVGFEQRQGQLDERCMVFIEQAVKTLAVPEQADGESGIENGGDPEERRDGDTVGRAALDPIDDRPGDLRRVGEPPLAPTSSSTKGAELQADPNDIHVRIVSDWPYRGLICRARVRR